ncbi:PIG-L deacetylase family protein [Peptostreptococcus faecalis]|uniref:PIG-L deacetylase family protein n=1 Tax=Peptostreptococcus faecalis TaxID=2045015 RepID=UPI000C7A9308|nr:PIG-L family deacetylase [Peptostreptococcus faecalis]
MNKNKIKKIIIPVANVYNKIYLNSYYKKNKINHNYELLDLNMKNKNILVMSPHQDDEIIGLGGTLARLSENNNITVLFLTDGSLISYENFPKKISAIRKKESDEVSSILGTNTSTLNFTNTTLDIERKKLENSIESMLKDNKFDIIFTPSVTDCTSDHRETSFALLNVLKSNKGDYLELYFYEINNSLQAGSINCISSLNINDIMSKRKLLDIYRSQKYIDFSIICINDREKRKMFRNNCYAVEIFHKLDFENMRSIIEKEKKCKEFENMKTTTSSIRLKKNMEYNLSYREKIESIFR